MIEVGLLYILLAIRFRPNLSGLSYDWLDSFLLRQENRRNRALWIVQLSLLLTIAACLYARLDLETNYLGLFYAQLAENPFRFDPANKVGYRLLTPLISYCLGLRGGLIIVTNLIIICITIGTIYSYFRNRFDRLGDAFLAIVTVTFSLVVLTSIHCGGYCDILTYLIIFLMWQHRSRRWLFYCLFLAGLLNHESIAFLIPWFAFISLQKQQHKKRRVAEMIIGFGLALMLYYFFRLWVGSHATVPFDINYYLGPILDKPMRMFRGTFPYHALGLFSVFKLLWVFPAAAALSFWKNKDFSELAGVGLLFFCSWAQLLIAYDTSRMFTLGFMIMIIALCHLLETNRFKFRRWAFWAVGLNLILPQPYTADKIIEIWQSVLTSLIA